MECSECCCQYNVLGVTRQGHRQSHRRASAAPLTGPLRQRAPHPSVHGAPAQQPRCTSEFSYVSQGLSSASAPAGGPRDDTRRPAYHPGCPITLAAGSWRLPLSPSLSFADQDKQSALRGSDQELSEDMLVECVQYKDTLSDRQAVANTQECCRAWARCDVSAAQSPAGAHSA